MPKKVLTAISIIGAIIFILTVGVAITRLTVHDLVSVDQQLKKNIMQLAYEHYDNPLERIAIKLGRGRIVSVNPPASAEVQFFTLFHIPLGVLRGQPDAKLGISQNLINPHEETDKIERAKEAVRKFTDDQDTELVYSDFSLHPSNFLVGISSGQNKEPKVMRVSSEWLRPVYIFQEKKFINNDCQVYQYEVGAENYEVIEIQTAWPRWFQPEGKNNCPDVYSQPAKSKEELESFALKFFLDVPKYNRLLLSSGGSDFSPKFTELKYFYEWLWEDNSISLPEGLTGDPYQHPVIKIMLTKDGRLDYYLNTTELFKK
jgi:hypothetical protein